jgi:hypothetical protein
MLGPSFRSVGRLARSISPVLAIALVAFAPAACSDDDAPAGCVDSKCAAGNKCIALDGATKCRKTCSSNLEAQKACPYGYTCTDTLNGAGPFCIEIAARNGEGKPITQKAGQWGQQCQPNLGLENPACDLGQGFYCYAQTPTDATAYCTRYECGTDRDCGAGFYCGKVNQTPNIATAKRFTEGDVLAVCLRRTYCTPCVSDIDCLPTEPSKITQRCVGDQNGTGSFCTPVCKASADCQKDARCVDAGLEERVCYPRAGACTGDGSLCSPCRSDADCGQEGICVKGEYTDEKACAKRAPGGDCAQCPKTADVAPKADIRCSTASSEVLPKGYCVGLYTLGEGGDLGCFTPPR